MKLAAIIAIAAPLAFLTGCGSAQSLYPSYQEVLAAQSPGDYQAEPLDGAPACAGDCRCPRVWDAGSWVYHCDGRWIYYHSGLWWSYPHLYIHYVHGVPAVYRRPTRNIGPAPKSRGFPTRQESAPRFRSAPGSQAPPSGTRNLGPPPKRSGD